MAGEEYASDSASRKEEERRGGGDALGEGMPADPVATAAATATAAETVAVASQKRTCYFGEYLLNKHVFENGSPGQITLLHQSGSKFCVEPRYQNPDISHISQNPI